MAHTIDLDRGFAGRGRRATPRRILRRVAPLAAALLLLALVAAAAFALTRPAAGPDAQQAATNPFANDPHVPTAWDFREDPRIYAPLPALDPEQYERTQVAPGAVPVASPNRFTGSCRPGSIDCLEDEHLTPGVREGRDRSQLVP